MWRQRQLIPSLGAPAGCARRHRKKQRERGQTWGTFSCFSGRLHVASASLPLRVQSCTANIGEARFTIRQNSGQTDFLHRGGRTRVHSLRPNKLQVVVLTFKNLPSDGQQQGHRSEQPIENFIHVDSAVVTSTPGRGVNWQLLNPSYTFS